MRALYICADSRTTAHDNSNRKSLSRMVISGVRVKNLGRFRDSGDIELRGGLNVIVGANSVGKTTLAGAISGTWLTGVHRTPKSVPTIHDTPAPASIVVTV